MKVEIHINHVHELRAYAKFCEAVADGHEKWLKENPPSFVGAGYGNQQAVNLAGADQGSIGTAAGNLAELKAQNGIGPVNPEDEKPGGPKATRTRKIKDAAPSISTTPEDRKPPEDDAETQEQDAADEAAEVEAARPAAAPLTVEDVMGAVGVYVEKFGLPAAQSDGPNIFVSALGTPPNGAEYWKKSLLATATQDQLQKALVAWKTAAAAEQRFVAKGA